MRCLAATLLGADEHRDRRTEANAARASRRSIACAWTWMRR